MKTQKSIFLVLLSLLALIGTSNLVYATSQNNFYGVWVSKNGGLFYEINKDAIVINRIDNRIDYSNYSNRYSISKTKYRIVKWEKDKANADKYVIYTLDEFDNKRSFEVSIDAYSDLFVFAPPMTLGMEMKKSSAVELNKVLKTAEAAEKAAEAAKKAAEEAKKVAEKVAEEAVAKIESQRGSFTDLRDNKEYKTIKIGNQTWMAENLNYEAEGSKCYDNNKSNCQKYGRLYMWETAKMVCPNGWHLPSNAEWDVLYHYVDGTRSGTESPYRSETAGKYLMADSGWKEGGNGTNAYGFAALPGGYSVLVRDDEKDVFENAGSQGNWWTSTEKIYEPTPAPAGSGEKARKKQGAGGKVRGKGLGPGTLKYGYGRYMEYNCRCANYSPFDEGTLFSIRCLKD
ncbi:MAG: fibrobacter succinogenes major paralogous domain-containing protein [Fibromonadales bacterium]|nr:fibrobacter succinogenes major paralogous domain-containing protein [Fibromonadales bacterium]